MTASCTHHWLLETPKEGRVAASCKLCGEERTFEDAARRAYGRKRTTAAVSSA